MDQGPGKPGSDQWDIFFANFSQQTTRLGREIADVVNNEVGNRIAISRMNVPALVNRDEQNNQGDIKAANISNQQESSNMIVEEDEEPLNEEKENGIGDALTNSDFENEASLANVSAEITASDSEEGIDDYTTQDQSNDQSEIDQEEDDDESGEPPAKISRLNFSLVKIGKNTTSTIEKSKECYDGTTIKVKTVTTVSQDENGQTVTKSICHAGGYKISMNADLPTQLDGSRKMLVIKLEKHGYSSLNLVNGEWHVRINDATLVISQDEENKNSTGMFAITIVNNEIQIKL